MIKRKKRNFKKPEQVAYHVTHPAHTDFRGDKQALIWVEEPERLGMRFAGFANEIDASIGHSGWYANEFGELRQGVVYRLPHGRALVGCTDPWASGVLLSPEIHDVADHRGESYNDMLLKDAAHAGDEFARVTAERDYEYSEAWGDVMDCSDAWREARKEAVKAYIAYRKLRAAINVLPQESAPTVVEAMQCTWERAQDDLENAKCRLSEARKLLDQALNNDQGVTLQDVHTTGNLVNGLP